jgi:RimJ/RimL family protein N-acetyltransferase
MPVIATERLLLRPWTPEDVEPYARIVADPEVMRYLGTGPIEPETAAAQVARFAAGTGIPGVYHFAAEERATGELIGRIGLFHQPEWPGPHKVEVGWLLDRRAWGRGLATEGARAAVNHGFQELGLPRIISFTRPENIRSRAVMERLGMCLAGQREWHGLPHVWYELAPP